MKKRKWKLSCLDRALGLVDGAVGQYLNTVNLEEKDLNEHFWQSMVWINDWFNGYYLGWDFVNEGYILEWRGYMDEKKKEYFYKKCIGIVTCDYVQDAAKILFKMIKQHKEDMKG